MIPFLSGGRTRPGGQRTDPVVDARAAVGGTSGPRDMTVGAYENLGHPVEVRTLVVLVDGDSFDPRAPACVDGLLEDGVPGQTEQHEAPRVEQFVHPRRLRVGGGQPDTVGHTLEEQAALRPENEESADAGGLHEAVVAGAYPHLAATLPVFTSTDFTEHFEFGLRLLLDGLRAVRQ
ncbi:TetR/AcrR family transcriptional regulator C-terminal domain-containing protein [Streptomyces sp. A73]|nr:TetR/AcrR family transcriptional regulator C-terminal domain-containing protein [Streptomyces sp. A73]